MDKTDAEIIAMDILSDGDYQGEIKTLAEEVLHLSGELDERYRAGLQRGFEIARQHAHARIYSYYETGIEWTRAKQALEEEKLK